MCGRYELKTKARELNKQFQQLHIGQREMPCTEEMQPGNPVLIITGSPHGHLASNAKWGLVGSFLDFAPPKPITTLCSEGLASKPFYSKILKNKRCLIPATAFFEWQASGNGKQKIRISHTNHEPLIFAGIFDHHPLAGTTCAILTTAANESMCVVHHRMPVILGREERSFWLEDHAEFPEAEFVTMLQTASSDALMMEAIIEEAPSPQMSLASA